MKAQGATSVPIGFYTYRIIITPDIGKVSFLNLLQRTVDIISISVFRKCPFEIVKPIRKIPHVTPSNLFTINNFCPV